MLTSEPETYVSLRRAATRLGVPMAWLKAQADAGQVPHLKYGRMRRFNVPAVESVLLRLAPGGSPSEAAPAPAALSKSGQRAGSVESLDRTSV